MLELSPTEIRWWRGEFRRLPPLCVMIGAYLGVFDRDDDTEDDDDEQTDAIRTRLLEQARERVADDA